MHTLRSDVAWTFSTCSCVVKLVEAAAIALPICSGAYHFFYVYDHTPCALCGKYVPEDAVCGETLKQLFAGFFDSKSFPHLHKPGDTNLFDLGQSQNSSEVLFWKYTISAVYFSVWYEGAGVVQAQAFS